MIAAIDCQDENCFSREAQADNLKDEEGYVIGVMYICDRCGLSWLEMNTIRP